MLTPTQNCPFPHGPNITAAWVPELPDGQALVQAISNRDWTGWYPWITGESTSTRHARTFLQREHNLSRATLHATAYWARGRAMGRSENVDDLASAPSEHGPDAAGSTAPAIDEPAAAIRQPDATRSRDTPRPDDPDGHDDARRPTAPP